MSQKLLLISGVIAGFFAGAAVVWVLLGGYKSGTYVPPLRLKGQYQLVAPLLACQTADRGIVPENKPLEQKISTAITSDKSAGKVSDVSVYLAQFNTGAWTGVNENELYAPASMNKVPLLIAYLEVAQQNPSILNKQILYTGSLAGADDEETVTPMVAGKTYTINDLLSRLIIYSDNDAKDYLHKYIDQSIVNNVFSDFGLPVPSLDETGDSMSPKEYSIFFRTLYNSTYLQPEVSQAALDLLSKTTFTQGLVAGITSSTTVAHKFGLRIFPTAQNDQNGITQELSDCGIVYTQPNPYTICVMTKGWNTADLQSTIADVSRAAYQYLSSSK